jgi:hypothetical protein
MRVNRPSAARGCELEPKLGSTRASDCKASTDAVATTHTQDVRVIIACTQTARSLDDRSD